MGPIRAVIIASMLLLVFCGFLSACRSNHAVQVAADYVSAADVRPASYAGNMPRFKALLYYSDQVEEAHRQFAGQAIEFFHRLTYGEGWILDVSSRLEDSAVLGQYNLIIMPNAAPETPEERALFEEYMENGGGWLGFHGAGYNDLSTGWDWFRDFMGGVRFLCNNWPPQPALVDIEGHDHAVTRNLPDQYVAPATEFYQWQPDPRSNPDVRILASLSLPGSLEQYPVQDGIHQHGAWGRMLQRCHAKFVVCQRASLCRQYVTGRESFP